MFAASSAQLCENIKADATRSLVHSPILSMNRFFAALALSCALAAPLAPRAHAQTPGWTPAPLFASDQISQSTLPNGARVVVKSTPGAPVVSIQVWVRGGSRAEKPGEEGLAHLIEVAAVNGSKNQPYSENGDEGGLDGAIRVVGGESGSLTSRDSTFYSAAVATPDWGRALSALADTVMQPDLSAAGLGRAKLIVANQLVAQVFNPVAQADDLAYQTAFPNHPYGHAEIGSQDTLGGLTVAKARDFYKRQYSGGNVSIVIVGDVAASEAVDACQRTFAGLSQSAPGKIDPKVGPLPAVREVSEQAPVSDDVLALAWRSPGIEMPRDVVATDALLALWREGLDANLRRLLLRDGPDGENKPLVDSYDVDYLTQRDPGLILITLVGVKDRDETIAVVEKEIKRLSDNGPTDAEMKRARELLGRQYLEQSENAAGQAGALGFYEMIADYKFALQYEQLTQTVTGADVQRIARDYLAPDKEIRATITPLPRARPGAPTNPNDATAGDGVTTVSWTR